MADPLYNRIINEHTNPGQIARRKLIADIEKLTQRRLIAYTANFDIPNGNAINYQDISLFTQCLSDINDAAPVDVMLHTPGGMLDVAIHLKDMLRGNGPRPLRIIVPNAAKSAGTLIALGADSIIMGPCSHLGPIDPQIPYKGAMLPAHTLVDSWKDFLDKINAKKVLEPGDVLAGSHFDQPSINLAQKVINDAYQVANNWLQQYMLKDDPDTANATASALALNRQSHGLPINADIAEQTYGLKIEKLPADAALWERIWELHLRSDVFLHMTGHAKMVETTSTTLAIRVQLQSIQPQIIIPQIMPPTNTPPPGAGRPPAAPPGSGS